MAVYNNGVGQIVDGIVLLLWLIGRVLEGDMILGQRGRDLDQGGQTDQVIANSMQVGILRNPLKCGKATNICRIMANNGKGLALD